jgi:LuxR family quorum sensing-dependent transcriptional regulator
MPSQLAADILGFTESVDLLSTPQSVLNGLDRISWSLARAHVLGAALLPLKFGDNDTLVLEKTVFLHDSVPREWWDERMRLSPMGPAPGDIAARLALAPFTLADILKSLEPIGIDRWAQELNLKFGIRDSFGCPIGGRWIFAYWAPKPMSLTPDQKAMLFVGATFATKRLQQLAPPFGERLGKGSQLTARELAVLRSLSLGRRIRDVGSDLGLGVETVRSHLKKAQEKLGVKTAMHAVSQAMRLRLIP